MPARRSSPAPRCSRSNTRRCWLALAGGAFLARPFSPPDASDTDFERKEPRFSASFEGFDVHCAVRVAAGDDEGRERLVRYCARPPFALERLSLVLDGRIAYLLKTPRKGRTHRVMSPVEFMARIAALIPPPKYPTVRYHGVFAPSSPWRKLVVPKPPAKRAPTCAPSPEPVSANDSENSRTAEPPRPAPSPAASGSALASLVVDVGPTTISVKHWGRLKDGLLFATSPRVDWRTLMGRTFGFDSLACPTCQRRMRVVATIVDPNEARRLLDHLGVRREPRSVAPVRDPTWEQRDLGLS